MIKIYSTFKKIPWTSIVISALFLITGCSNYPYPRDPLNPDGTQKIIWYQSLEEDPRTLDPQVAYDTVSAQVLFNINEPLLQYNYLKRQSFELQPLLAEGIPQRVPRAGGGETFIVKIKKGIRYSDDPCFVGGKGRELITDDFIYALKRIADPHIKTPTASPVYEPMAAVILGMTEFYETAQKAGTTDYTRAIDGLEKVDNYTLKIHLKSPYPQLKYWMALNFFAPVPAEAVAYYDGLEHDGVRRDQFMFHPVGTGPFKLKQWERNSNLILTRNENYHGATYPSSADPGTPAKLLEDAGKPLPFIDEARFSIIREAIPVWTLFRQGYIDSLGRAARRQGDTIQQVLSNNGSLTEEMTKSGVTLEYVPLLSTDYIAFNMRDSVVGSNKKLRQAISMAYDIDRFIDFFYNGVKLKAESLIPPGIYGYDKDYKNPYRILDVAKAKQLMKEAGYADGIDPKTGTPLTLEVVYQARGPESQREAQYIQEQFSALGIKANIKLVTFAEMLNIYDSGRFQLTRSGWFADYPDPENFLFLFYSKNSGIINTSRYNNPEYDRLFLQMQNMEDSPERLALIQRMRQILDEDCATIYTFHDAYYVLNQGWTEHVLQHPVAFDLLKYYKVDPKLREQKQQEWNQPNYLFVLALAGLLTAAVIPVALSRRDSL